LIHGDQTIPQIESFDLMAEKTSQMRQKKPFTIGEIYERPVCYGRPMTHGQGCVWHSEPYRTNWKIVKETYQNPFPSMEDWVAQTGQSPRDYYDAEKYWRAGGNGFILMTCGRQGEGLKWVLECLDSIPFSKDFLNEKNTWGCTHLQYLVSRCGPDVTQKLIDLGHLSQDNLTPETVKLIRTHNPNPRGVFKVLKEAHIYEETMVSYVKNSFLHLIGM
jgi:hypothetical protein